jgi:hypothetical protein
MANIQVQNGPANFQSNNHGEMIDVPGTHDFAIGDVILRANCKHDLEETDRLWYTYVGEYGTRPRIDLLSNYASNRNFGNVNAMRRSNAAVIGQVSTSLYMAIHRQRAHQGGWHRFGPVMGQHQRKRVDMLVMVTPGGNNIAKGWRNYPRKLKVLAMWRR